MIANLKISALLFLFGSSFLTSVAHCQQNPDASERLSAEFLKSVSPLIGTNKEHPVRADFVGRIKPTDADCGNPNFQFCDYVDSNGLEYFFISDGRENDSDILSTVDYSIIDDVTDIRLFSLGLRRSKKKIMPLIENQFSGMKFPCWSGVDENNEKFHNCSQEIGDYWLTINFDGRKNLKGFLFTYHMAIFGLPERVVK